MLADVELRRFSYAHAVIVFASDVNFIFLAFILRPRIEDSKLSNAVGFSSARTTKRFPVVAMRVSNPDCSPLESKAETYPSSTALLEIGQR